MKKIILVILAVIICGPILAKHKHKKKRQKTGNIKSVSIRRTACYGRCPDYTVEIRKDGAAIYTGRHFTPDTGVFQKNIGIDKAIGIINMVNAYRVDTCRNMYRSRISDIPGLIITVVYNDSIKTINNANFGPDFLEEIADSADNAGKKTDNTWQKINPPNTK